MNINTENKNSTSLNGENFSLHPNNNINQNLDNGENNNERDISKIPSNTTTITTSNQNESNALNNIGKFS